ncbi:hypothetical protein Hanom_Chr17g01539381 [Helianthus anomalus]
MGGVSARPLARRLRLSGNIFRSPPPPPAAAAVNIISIINIRIRVLPFMVSVTEKRRPMKYLQQQGIFLSVL